MEEDRDDDLDKGGIECLGKIGMFALSWAGGVDGG